MNAALRAIVKVAAGRGVEVLGVLEGYEGLIDGRFRDLTRDVGGELAPIHAVEVEGCTGGTLLGSARSARFRGLDGRRQAARQLAGIDALIVIGGNGSLTGAHLLTQETEVPIVGVPASIDNDIGCTATAVGVDTALNTIVEACDRLADTARSHRRCFVVEVMGRHCGYLAMASGVALAAEGVLFRESGRSDRELVDSVEDVVRRAWAPGRDKKRVIVIKSEGVELPCHRLVALLERRLADLPDAAVRSTVLGHVVRGGHPSFQDRMVAARLALGALEAALTGRSDVMAAWQAPVPGGHATADPAVTLFELSTVLEQTAALLDGSSAVTRKRVALMESIEGVLAL